MSRRLILSAAGLAVTLALLLRGEPPLDLDRDLAVGRATRAYRDSQRRSWVGEGDRPLETLIWYPAESGAVESEWYSGIPPFKVFRFGVSAAGAARRAGRYPLVLLSHGTGGSARQLAWLGEALASKGFIVAAVSHHGNTSDEAESIPHGYYLWWERAADLSRVLDRLLADGELAAAIDPRRIAAAGFSLGGYTALALAGARLDMDEYRRWCARTGCVGAPEAPISPDEFRERYRNDPAVTASLARAEDSYRDARVRAVVAIAPAPGSALDDRSLAEIAIPLLIIVGDRDDRLADARRIAAIAPNAVIEVLQAVGHYTFLAPCAWFGRLVLPALCRDPTTSRSETHRRVAASAVSFLGDKLGRERAAAAAAPLRNLSEPGDGP